MDTEAAGTGYTPSDRELEELLSQDNNVIYITLNIPTKQLP